MAKEQQINHFDGFRKDHVIYIREALDPDTWRVYERTNLVVGNGGLLEDLAGSEYSTILEGRSDTNPV